jgi:hypothetical protein
MALAVPVAVVVACGGNTVTKGELVVSIQTDMSLPKDIDTIGVQVSAGGVLQFGNDYPVGAGQVLIPATLGVLQGNDPAQSVKIRVTARKNNKLLVLRDVTTTVPSGRIATLRVPVQWLCQGQAVDGTSSSGDLGEQDGAATSNCATSNQTCIAGTCQPAELDSAKLPTYDPTQIFGGASAPGTGGTCLDTLGCFSQGNGVAVQTSDCSIAKPTGGQGINVALMQGAGGSGICGSQACMLPLDANADDGTGWTDQGNGRIGLPTAVCTKLAANPPQISGVAVTTACATKTQAVPTCGSWSSTATDAPVTLDAGGPAPQSGGGSGIVTGQIDGFGLTVSDSLSSTGTINGTFTSDGGTETRQVLVFEVMDQSGACALAQSGQLSTGVVPPSSTFAGAVIVGADATTPIGAGTYPIISPSQTSGSSVTFPAAIFFFNHESAQCRQTPAGTAADSNLATGGSITISSAGAQGSSGSFTAQLQGGTISGSFTAANCALDTSSIFQGNTTSDAGVPAGQCQSNIGNGSTATSNDGGVVAATCATVTGTAPTCNPVTSSGCAKGTACEFDTTNGSTICGAPGTIGAGGSCLLQSDCAAGLFCTSTGTCAHFCCTQTDCPAGADAGPGTCTETSVGPAVFAGVCTGGAQ